MGFYDMLQLDPAALKNAMRSAETGREKRRFFAAMALRALLLVAFAMVIIMPSGALFGSENNPVAVALFCVLLSIRFVDFGYCVRDSLINLFLIFLLLLLAPIVNEGLPLPLATVLHLAFLFTILRMSSDAPEMGNGGLYGFAYVYLTGSPVRGALLVKRAELMALGYVLCALIFYQKHHKKHGEMRYRYIAKSFDLKTKKSRWQLRMALGVSASLALGQLLQLERFMWAGFAAASVLSTYSDGSAVRERLSHRILGVLEGSLLFFLIYQLLPEALHGLMGPLGGICLGFCTEYRFKTALNCLGALLLASGLYGLHGAVLLRIYNNLLGVGFGICTMVLFDELVERRWGKETV